MTNTLFYNTVGTRLLSALQLLMKSDEFSMFRLVGGTSLSLQFLKTFRKQIPKTILIA